MVCHMHKNFRLPICLFIFDFEGGLEGREKPRPVYKRGGGRNCSKPQSLYRDRPRNQRTFSGAWRGFTWKFWIQGEEARRKKRHTHCKLMFD